MKELKPCPFCGSYNVRVCTIPTGYKRNPRVWYMKCDDCESRGSRVFDKYEAIGAWNARPERTCHMETAEGCQNWNSCSECDADYYTDQPINYCPNCGARVVGE